MAVDSNEILKKHGLRVTGSRVAVLGSFLQKNAALSHSDLEVELGNTFDRVTLYRTLKTFLEYDLIHKVLDDSGAAKFALCNHQHHGDVHDHEHVHFKCEECGKIICLDHIGLPKINLPEGFIKKETNLLVQGICQNCN